MSRGWKNSDSHNQIILDYSEEVVVGRWTGVKCSSGDGKQLSEEDGRQIFIFLGNVYIIMIKVLLERCMLKVFPVRYQVEIRTCY